MTLQVINRAEPITQRQPGARTRRHVLDLDDFSVEEVETVLETATRMKDVLSRPIKKVPTLRGKTLVTLFYEASTRTRVGFEVAAKALGADTVSVAAATSSVTKGESLIDTIRTLQALGADFVVMRHHQAGAPYVVAEEVSASVINAGDGWHAHPTQALLDLFTIRERLGRIAGLRRLAVERRADLPPRRSAGRGGRGDAAAHAARAPDRRLVPEPARVRKNLLFDGRAAGPSQAWGRGHASGAVE